MELFQRLCYLTLLPGSIALTTILYNSLFREDAVAFYYGVRKQAMCHFWRLKS